MRAIRRAAASAGIALSVFVLPAGLSGAIVDVLLPSTSTGVPNGKLALRLYTPQAGQARYPQGAPVLVWGPGGTHEGLMNNQLPVGSRDLIVINFLFPGGGDPNLHGSDGTYDYRGPACIQALRDVVLYAAGQMTDDLGRTIDDVSPVTVLHDNIGLVGSSNGGNIVVAVAAMYGTDLAGYLRYIIQWESPVSSQIATRDFGRILFAPSLPTQGDFVNPRYGAYGTLSLPVDFSDLAYDAGGPLYEVFHDGTGDGHYTTIVHPQTSLPTPDLNLDGVLDANEDFPLDAYPTVTKDVYSRAVTQALQDNNVFAGPWPSHIATVAEANAYWDIREAGRLYDEAAPNMPGLEAMVLAGVRDHVQATPDKPHVRQAFEGWLGQGVWVQVNPDAAYLVLADPNLTGRTDLPDNAPNAPPADWADVAAYAVPADIDKGVYQLAAVWQMADRVQGVELDDSDPPASCCCLASAAPTIVGLLALAGGFVRKRTSTSQEDKA